MAYKNITQKRILAVFAHPDDETFMAGGFMRSMAENNNEVFLFMATKGEGGGDPAIRAKELRKAANLIGIKKVYQDMFSDGKLYDTKPLLEVELKRLMLKVKPHIIITFNSGGKDRETSRPHPDHKTISLVVQKLFTYFREREVVRDEWKPEALYLAIPIFPSCSMKKNSLNFNIKKYLGAKIEALKGYKSQGKGCWEALGTNWSEYICSHESFVVKK